MKTIKRFLSSAVALPKAMLAAVFLLTANYLPIAIGMSPSNCYSQGTRIWATYYGGPGQDGSYSVATDISGNVYIGGYTTSASGIASGGFQNTYGGGTYDAFLVKLSSTGERLWATY